MVRINIVFAFKLHFTIQLYKYANNAHYMPCASVTALMHNSLHWLSYPQRVTYKLSLLTYKCLQGLAPAYLTRLCVPTFSVLDRSRLRSADDNQLVVPRTLTSTFGPRAFSTSGPAAWNTVVWATWPVHLTWLF